MDGSETKYSNADRITMIKLFNLVENVNENIVYANKEITALKVNVGKNNVILKQHHSRSTNLEGVVDKMKELLNKLIGKVDSINTNVNRMDEDLTPIQKHVIKIEKWTNMILGVPMFFKLVFWVCVFISSGYGCYNVIVKWLN